MTKSCKVDTAGKQGGGGMEFRQVSIIVRDFGASQVGIGSSRVLERAETEIRTFCLVFPKIARKTRVFSRRLRRLRDCCAHVIFGNLRDFCICSINTQESESGEFGGVRAARNENNRVTEGRQIITSREHAKAQLICSRFAQTRHFASAKRKQIVRRSMSLVGFRSTLADPGQMPNDVAHREHGDRFAVADDG